MLWWPRIREEFPVQQGILLLACGVGSPVSLLARLSRAGVVLSWGCEARVAKLADARDLKSRGVKAPCGFDSRPGHQILPGPSLRSGFRHPAPAQRCASRSRRPAQPALDATSGRFVVSRNRRASMGSGDFGFHAKARRRRAELALKGAVERRLGFVADLGSDLRDATTGRRKQLRTQLQPPTC
jgi:hypothetical protein